MIHNMVERRAVGLDATYGALADPTRRAILMRLRAGETRVTDVARPIPMSLAAVSRHISVLERAGLIERDVRGRDHYLRVVPERLGEAVGWLEEYTDFWEDRADELTRHLIRRRAATEPS